MKRSTYASIVLVAVVVGLLISVQFRVTNRALEQGVPAGRVQELAVELNRLQNDNSNLRKEITGLENKLEHAGKGREEALEALRGELGEANMIAGLVTVSGPGIELTLDNPPEVTKQGMGTNPSIIRDEDLLRVVNELRGAGVEAISINGQRIHAISEIRLAAPFINVNTVRIVPPYHILAIGDPNSLESALEIPGGFLEYLRDLGIEVKVQRRNNLVVPGYEKKLDFRYAKPVQKG